MAARSPDGRSRSLYEDLYYKNRSPSMRPESDIARDRTPDETSYGVTGNAPTVAHIHSSSPNDDFYKGFYDGTVMRQDKSGSRIKYIATTYIAPMMANTLVFALPFLYMRYRMQGGLLDVYPFSYFKQFFPKGRKTKHTPQSMMEMFTPLKPRDFEIKLQYDGKSKILTFADVFGVEEAKKELLVYKKFIENPAKYTKFGAKLPKGMLLVGKPGVGKTMLMKAFVSECNRHLWDKAGAQSSNGQKSAQVALFSAVGSDFIELYGGSGPKRVRELFNQARKKLTELQDDAKEDEREKCAVVVFIDEIDALGCRGGGTASDGRTVSGGISSEENRTINQILSELDGLESMENVIVIGATNNPEALDKALLREGRFDKKVHLSLPDIPARTEIFHHYLKAIVTEESQQSKPANVKTGTSASLTESPSKKTLAVELAERTPGTSPAQLSTIVNEAAITAAVKDGRYVSRELLHNAIDDVLIGKKRRNRMSKTSIERTAIHECGHCLTAWYTSPTLQTKVLKISLIPRGMAGGYTQQLEREESDLVSVQSLFSTLCVLVSGRVAEEIAYIQTGTSEETTGESTNAWDTTATSTNQSSEGISTGAYDDLQRATQIAAEMIMAYGKSCVRILGSDESSPSAVNDIAETAEDTMLSFPVKGEKNGRGWLPYSENYHSYIEEKSKELIDLAFLRARKLLREKKKNLFALRDSLLEKQELNTAAIGAILGPRPE